MKQTIFLAFPAILLFGAAACSTAPPQTAQTAPTANTAVVAVKTDNSAIMRSSRSATKEPRQPAPQINNGAAPQSDSPTSTGNAQPIDTAQLDAAIAKAEKDYKAKPADAAAQKNLANAYAERAFALTQAAQYRAALGDFRRALKLDPADAEAKKMHDEIVGIFKSMNREPPAEGTEPTPLPFKKDA